MEICVSKLYGPPKKRSIQTIRKFPRGCGLKATETITGLPIEVKLLTPSETASLEKKEGYTEDAALQEDKVPGSINMCAEKPLVDGDTTQKTKEKKEGCTEDAISETTCSEKKEGRTEDAALHEDEVSNLIYTNADKSLLGNTSVQEIKASATACLEMNEGCSEDAALHEDGFSKGVNNCDDKSLVDKNTVQNMKSSETSCSEKKEGCTEAAALLEDVVSNDKVKESSLLDRHHQLGGTEVELCTSKLYGPPKRRKLSAIRQFPPNCGQLAVVREPQTVGAAGFYVSSEANALIEHTEPTVDKIPLIQDRRPTKGNQKTTSSNLDDTTIHVSTTHITKASISKVNSKKDKFNDAMDMFNTEKESSQTRDKSLTEPNGYKKSLNKRKLSTGEAELTNKFILEDTNFIPKKVKREKTIEKSSGKASSDLQGEKSHSRISHRKEHSTIGSKLPNKAGAAEKDPTLPVGKLVPTKPEKGDKNKKRKYTDELKEYGGESTPVSTYESVMSSPDQDRIIVLALMASSNCPWRHGKGSGKIVQQSSSTPVKAKRRIKSTVKSSPSNNLSKSREIYIPEDQTEDLPLDSIPRDENFSDKETERGQLTYEYTGELSVMETPSKPPGWNHTESHEEVGKRNKVRRALRLFQVICRKLLQEEESRSRGKGKVNRVDLEAANIMKKKNEYVNPGKSILGLVPGVEIGDEFHYRTELAIVGLHRPFQAGIDRAKVGDIFLATSIVAGCDSNEMENSDILVYSGSGGSAGDGDKLPEDQKLEGGNLALKNSMDAKEPVRVIRSSKEVKVDSRDGKAKTFSTFVYDGLYTVEKYWKERVRQGFLAFKFELKRIPGQPELPSKEVKKSHKPSVRPGVCIKDISDGKEKMPICVVNTIDNERPSPFRYITRIRYPSSFELKAPRGCDCTDGCSDSENCACAVKNGGEIPYNYNGAIVQAKPLVYECGPMCKCPPTCHNRVSQHGIKIPLEVFKTKSMGWGVRSLSSIASGSFICEYIGELIPDKEAELRKNDEYLFDIGHNYDDRSLWEGLPTLIPELQSSSSQEDKDSAGFTIDAAEFANVGRFINHSCSPNLYAQNVLYDHDDKKMPHIMLFAAENIPPLQELTYHYNYMIDQVRDIDGSIKRKDCYCGSDECTGRLY